MMRPASPCPPSSPSDSYTYVCEPRFQSNLTQTSSTVLDSPSGGIAPAVTAHREGLNSLNDPFGDKNTYAGDANAMGSGDSRTTSSAAPGADLPEVTTPAKKRTRQRRLWFRNLPPVRTRSSTGSLPGISKNPYTQTTPKGAEGVTPTKQRKPRTTPSTTPAVKKPTSSRKRKSAPIGRARKRSRRSLALGDKQVEGDIGNDDGQVSEVYGNDETEYEDKVRTPGVSDNEASSPGGYCDEQDTDACTKPDGSVPRDRVKTPGVSDDGASSARQSEHSIDNVSGTPAWVDSQGSAEAPDEDSSIFQVDGSGVEASKEIKAAILDGEPNHGKTTPTEYQAEDRLSVQNHHCSVETRAKPELGSSNHQGPSEGTESEVQDVSHSSQLQELANVMCPSKIRFAMILPTTLSPEDFIANIESFKFQDIFRPRSGVTHLFIYFAAPISQVLFVASISPVGNVPSLPVSESEGAGPGSASTHPYCVDYKVDSLWHLAEGISLVKLQEAYGYEATPTKPIEVSPEILAAHAWASMRKVF